jgi:hypothetical protein
MYFRDLPPSPGNSRIALIRRSEVKMKKLLLMVLLLPLSSFATDFYISPTGSDSNGGSSSRAPWKTFTHAVNLLFPGDTLNLLDGTYTTGANGAFLVNCSSGAHNGTSAAPVTIQAVNERQALIQGNGLADTISINNCSYWNIIGLHAKQQDAVSSISVSIVNLRGDSHLTVRRNILDHINRCTNNNVMLVGANTSNSIIEENEIYFFHRWGIIVWSGSSGNEIRRNYSNSRGYFQASNSTCSTYGQGSVGVGPYYGNSNIFENNIAENSANGINLEAASSNNTYLGNVAIGSTQVGFQTNPHCPDTGTTNTWKQNVAINNTSMGWWIIGSTNATLDHNSVFGGGQAYGFRWDPSNSSNVCGTQSFTSGNNTAQNNGTGYYVAAVAAASYSYDHNSSFGNSSSFSPNLSVTNPISVNPAFGSCYLWVPDGSPLKGAGAGGTDVGANILYQYVGGALTSTSLWDQSTGSPLFKGATVGGLNDVAGQSLFDVANRLNINRNGCSFPVAYAGGGGSAPFAPTGLTAVVQ